MFLFFFLILTSGIFAQHHLVDRNQAMLKIPETYHFPPSFEGQTPAWPQPIFQQILINDLKVFMESLSRGGHDYFGDEEQSIMAMVDALNSYYSYDENKKRLLGIKNTSSFHISAQDDDHFPLPLGQNGVQFISYGQLAGREKNLEDNMARKSKNNLVRGELKGWNTDTLEGISLSSFNPDSHVQPEDFIHMLFQVTASLAVSGEEFFILNGNEKPQHITEAFITEQGLDLAQLVQKFLHGAVSFSMASTHHLAFDWETIKNDEDRAWAAWHWDQAFGYFGASRNFINYKGKGDYDEDGDGFIDIYGEKVFGVAGNTVRFDLSANPSERLQENSFKAFILGRHLVDSPGNEVVVQEMATTVLEQWEKTIAATVIHYLNSTIKQMDVYGTESYSFKKHAKYWAEMKGYALAAQFNPSSILSDENFDRIHLLMGDHPILGHEKEFDDYKGQLLEARNIFASPYKFAKYNVENW